MLLSKKKKVTKNDPELSVSKQCKLLGLNRSSVYYKEKQSTELEIQIKHAIDEMHTAHPAWGTRRIAATLVTKGYLVDRKLVRRYMQEMRIYAIYPKPNLSIPNKQVWSIDITYIPMGRSFMYLTAIIDWHSRYIVGYELSDTLQIESVLTCVNKAIKRYGIPEIINSDQRSQFTSHDYTHLR
ncbi:MAG: DDE-type integrase/transposase/recombinase [Niameybacter sp.]|uniref:DDE-type integrase/transposase/recombinase n=1 Tax=Niameybacter sp. TaxID=2033640 RepID=UPI002FC6A81F